MRGPDNLGVSLLAPRPPRDEQSRPIDTVEPLGVVRVAYVEGSDDEVDRLQAMGLCAGRRVQLLKCGDPLIVRVFGTRIGLSARLARRVYVDVCREK